MTQAEFNGKLWAQKSGPALGWTTSQQQMCQLLWIFHCLRVDFQCDVDYWHSSPCLLLVAGLQLVVCQERTAIQSEWPFHFAVFGWVGTWIPQGCPWKTRMPEFSSFWRHFQTILGPSVFHIVFVQFVGQISSHGEVLRNDHLCSGNWLLMLVSVAGSRPPLNRAWHETLQRGGRGHVQRRQPYGLCFWTWGSNRRSLQT